LPGGRDTTERMAGYYDYLFTFPSRGAMVSAVIVLSTLTGILSYAIGWGVRGDIRVLVWCTLGLSAPILLSDLLVLPLFRDEKFLNPRRFTILTYASAIVYSTVVSLSSVFSVPTRNPGLILRGVMLAVAVNAALRYLNIRVFTTELNVKTIIASFTQPALCFGTASAFLSFTGTGIPVLGLLAVTVSVGGIQLLLMVLDGWEDDHQGLRLIPLFRAFILAWAEDVNEPLEKEITRLGEARDLAVDSLVFEDGAGGYSAALIVPYIHPGPFRNVGSSGLPVVLAEKIGEKLGCEALVAHGVSTHEADLTFRDDNDKIERAVASNLFSAESTARASPMVWATRDGAQASCQLFGDVALITLSLSPKSYDDLPDEVRNRIMESARGMGVTAAVVDSHHSIDLESGLEDYDPDTLHEAAIEALSHALKMPQYPFAVGAARVIPEEWGLDEGVGPCGIAALALRLEGGQTSAYVVVDGNNMVSGLRERIAGAVRDIGLDEAEVMTSDIHLVNAIGKSLRGYHPIGEKTDEERLTKYIVEAVENAVSRLRKSNMAHVRTVIPGLTVLGSKGLGILGDVLESGFDLFKMAGLTIMSTALLLAFAILFLL